MPLSPFHASGSSQQPDGWMTLFTAQLTVAAALILSPLDYALASMVAAGQGLDAIEFALGLSRDAILDRVVDLGLPTPHDRAMRPLSGKTPWSRADTQALVRYWLAGVRVVSVAQELGRSPGSVSSKGKRIGLPKRDRKALYYLGRQVLAQRGAVSAALDAQAATPAVVVPSPPDMDAAPKAISAGQDFSDTAAQEASEAEAGTILAAFLRGPAPIQAPVSGSIQPAKPIAQNNPLGQLKWSAEQETELVLRTFANQKREAIARAMGRSEHAIQCKLSRLQIPRPQGQTLVDDYDPDLGQRRLAQSSYKRRFCVVTKRYFYSRTTTNQSRESKSTKYATRYSDLYGGIA